MTTRAIRLLNRNSVAGTQPPMKLRDGDLMTVSDAAARLGLGTEMVAKLRRSGRIPVVRTVGGMNLFLTQDIDRLKKERAKNPPRPGRHGSARVPVP